MSKAYWKAVHDQAWAETRERARNHPEIAIGSIVIAIVAILLLWFGVGGQAAAEELVAKGAGTAAILLGLAWIYWAKLISIPARWDAEKSAAKDAAERKLADLTAVPQRIPLIEFAKIADEKFGWDLFSGSSHSGWELWDLKSGLAQAASHGYVTFEGKRFSSFANPPPDSAFLRRDELFAEINRDDWHQLRLEICVLGMHFGVVASNFDLTICSTLDGDSTRYWDVQITDRAAAERWLGRESERIRGRSEEIHNQEQERRARLKQELLGQNAQEASTESGT